MMKRIFKYKLTLNAMLLFFKAQSVAVKVWLLSNSQFRAIETQTCLE